MTELQQVLKQSTDVFGEATAQNPLLDFVQLQSELKKITLLEVGEGGTCPSAP